MDALGRAAEGDGLVAGELRVGREDVAVPEEMAVHVAAVVTRVCVHVVAVKGCDQAAGEEVVLTEKDGLEPVWTEVGVDDVVCLRFSNGLPGPRCL